MSHLAYIWVMNELQGWVGQSLETFLYSNLLTASLNSTKWWLLLKQRKYNILIMSYFDILRIKAMTIIGDIYSWRHNHNASRLLFIKKTRILRLEGVNGVLCKSMISQSFSFNKIQDQGYHIFINVCMTVFSCDKFGLGTDNMHDWGFVCG